MSPVAQGGEDAARHLALGEPGVGGRHERRVLQVRPVGLVVDLPQRGQVQQAGHPQHVLVVHVQLADEQLQHVVGDRRGDLQPDRRAEPAPGQLPFQGLEQVLVAVLVDLHLGVAGDPEQVALDHLHAGEQLPQVHRDQVLHRQHPHARLVPVDPDEAGHVVGHLHPGEQLGAAVRVADRHRQVQRPPGDVRERVRRVHRERGQHREDLLPEVGAQPLPLGVAQLAPAQDADALVGQLGQHVVDEAGGVPGAPAPAVRSAISSSCVRRGSRSPPRTGRPAESRRFSPAIRTM